MNKTIVKIFLYFTITAAVVSTALLAINFIGFEIIESDTSNIYSNSPRKTLDMISDNLTEVNGSYTLKENILPQNFWCILLNEKGEIIWSENKPDDIPEKYTINDIARMTRWFLNDYPVYVSTEDYGLIVMGTPKNSVGKYFTEYSTEWFDTLLSRIIKVILFNLFLAATLAFILGIGLYRRLSVLMKGIKDLQQEKPVRLNEKGIFKEISHSINDTSEIIARKNAALAIRDNARSNWISGISHDIRTPLSLIIGYSEELSRTENIPEESRKKSEIITNQGVRIKRLVEDLNLISSLEYDMQPSEKRELYMCPLIRRVTADIINSGTAENFEIILNLKNEGAKIWADESLLERAVFNIINNSIEHNKNGCKIEILHYTLKGRLYIEINDSGKGAPIEVLENIKEIPKSLRGMGLPMAYRIISVHGGILYAVNKNGLNIKIELPLIKF